MKLREFMTKYFPDKKVLKASKTIKDIFSGEQFTYDVMYVDEESGEQMKALEVEGVIIPIQDIFEMSEKDFSEMYKTEACKTARELYLENFTIVYGEDLLRQVQRDTREAIEKIYTYENLEIDAI